MLLFFIKIPLLVAKFKIIAITLGTAKPKAHGQEATKTPIPLSTIQHTPQIGTSTKLKYIKIDHTNITAILRRITPLTKYDAIFLHAT